MRKKAHTGTMPPPARKEGKKGKPAARTRPPEKKPSCVECGCRPAIELEVARDLPGSAGFCSLECAARFGSREYLMSNLSWCKRHDRWTNRHGTCEGCLADRRRRYGEEPTREQVLFAEIDLV
jgi:hypothetical protein